MIVGLNPAAENILGISAQRAHGESFLQLVDDEPELRDILSRASRRAITTPTKCGSAQPRFMRGAHCRLPRVANQAAERRTACRDDRRYATQSDLARKRAVDSTRRRSADDSPARTRNQKPSRRYSRRRAIAGATAANDEQREYTDVVISETDRLAGLVDTCWARAVRRTRSRSTFTSSSSTSCALLRQKTTRS